MESENQPRIEVRGAKQAIWWDAMTSNDTIRIKYASKYAGSSNYWKNSMGMNEAITNMDVLDEKEGWKRGFGSGYKTIHRKRLSMGTR